MIDPDLVAARLPQVIATHIGAPGTVLDLERLTAGANKGTWSFDAIVGDERLPLILQLSATLEDTPGDTARPWIPLLDGEREMAMLAQAAAAGVPVPRLRHVLRPPDGLGEGGITDRLDGETLGMRILRLPELAQARSVMAGQCGSILAAVHRMDGAKLPFLRHFGAQQTLDTYRAVLDGFAYAQPALETALRWASERMPRGDRTTVVHGDFRNGNFIVGPEGIRAALDWEVAHLGDPMEDLGYVCMRTWRFGGSLPVGGFGRREAMFEAYEKAGGGSVDPDEVRWWEVAGGIRWALGCVRRAFTFREQAQRQLEYAGVGRRIEEPIYDILNLIEGRD